MPYDSIQIATALTNPEIQSEIWASAVKQSAILSMARRAPNLGTTQRKVAVQDTMPLAYFVGETDGVPNKKQTTSMAWKNKYFTAEEIAVIVPISEAVLADTSVDLLEVVKAPIAEAMGRTLDVACFAGTNLPATWLTNTSGAAQSIGAGALAAGQVLTIGAGGADIYDQTLGEDGVFSRVEQNGYMVNGSVMHPAMLGKIRGLRADSGAGQPVFARALDGSYSFGGERVFIAENGGLTANGPLIVGDWSQLAYAIRQDLTFKVLTEGVIQDAEGAIVYNLAQQDMIALRCVMRLAVQIANPVNALNTNEATRSPFAALTEAGS